MTTSPQFRVLFREFLFRVVDRELLSTYAQGDVSKLLLRFVSLLLFIGLVSAFMAAMLPATLSPPRLLVQVWQSVNSLIALTMLVVGLFAVLSWNTLFPDRLDALVLIPLPVRPRTVFAAKVAAVAAGLGLAVLSLHVPPSLMWPLRLQATLASGAEFSVAGIVVPPGASMLGAVRSVAAYWFTMIAAGLSVTCFVIAVQGIAANLLSRLLFLRVSSYLQLATFAAIMSGYFLMPTDVTPTRIAAAQGRDVLALPPSYWFLALFQQVSGTPRIGPIAGYAWWTLALTVGAAAVAYSAAYFRTLRKITESSDIQPAAGVSMPWPRVGSGRQTAIVHFSVRTLLRSTQHRVILAFYLGIGFAVTIMFLALIRRGPTPSPASPPETLWRATSIVIIGASVVMLIASIIGARVVSSLPRDLRANWIFRLMPLAGGTAFLGARRRALFAMSVLPIWTASAIALLLTNWPLVPAAGHLLVLWLLGLTLVELHLYGTPKIPFTCSYLPGRAAFQTMFWVSLVFVLMLTMAFSLFERRALDEPVLFAVLAGLLLAAWLLTRLVTTLRARGMHAAPQFEEEPPDRLVALGVWDLRVQPRAPPPDQAVRRAASGVFAEGPPDLA